MDQDSKGVAVRSEVSHFQETLQRMVDAYGRRQRDIVETIRGLEDQLEDARRAESAARSALMELNSGAVARRG